jgi:hypothetical protein
MQIIGEEIVGASEGLLLKRVCKRRPVVVFFGIELNTVVGRPKLPEKPLVLA